MNTQFATNKEINRYCHWNAEFKMIIVPMWKRALEDDTVSEKQKILNMCELIKNLTHTLFKVGFKRMFLLGGGSMLFLTTIIKLHEFKVSLENGTNISQYNDQEKTHIIDVADTFISNIKREFPSMNQIDWPTAEDCKTEEVINQFEDNLLKIIQQQLKTDFPQYVVELKEIMVRLKCRKYLDAVPKVKKLHANDLTLSSVLSSVVPNGELSESKPEPKPLRRSQRIANKQSRQT